MYRAPPNNYILDVLWGSMTNVRILSCAMAMFGVAMVGLSGQSTLAEGQDPKPLALLFDTDPRHPWNVVFGLLQSTSDRKFLKEEFQKAAVTALDGLFQDIEAFPPRPPIQRVLMQRVAWAAFDELASQDFSAERSLLNLRRTLRHRLAKLISLIALTPAEIGSLSGNMTAQALGDELKRNPVHDLNLPADLMNPNGEWVPIVHKSIRRIALTHESSHGGRSEFVLFLRFPQGRDSLETFLSQFSEFAKVESRKRTGILNRLIHRNEPLPPFPDLPPHVQVVLLERMLVISTEGIPTATPLVETLAMNQFTPTNDPITGNLRQVRNAVFEVSLQHLVDSKSNVSLRRLTDSEPFFGETHFARGLQQCSLCHSGRGLISLQGGAPLMVSPDDRSIEILPRGMSPLTSQWKSTRYEFGLLQGILESISLPHSQ